MTLAIFDLDNTLIAGDSDYLWGQYLVQQGIVDGTAYEAANLRFYEQYQSGQLDIKAFLEFALAPLSHHSVTDLERWREDFVRTMINPILLPAARELIAAHQECGRIPLIITATNAFVTAPIADLYGISQLIATVPQQVAGQYTGRYEGTPCFREGKVLRLQEWLAATGHSLEGSWFYSDSHNDLPLLKTVSHPVAVDPDDTLKKHALDHQWHCLTLRGARCDSRHLEAILR